jgi:hypothetical protein
LRRPGSPRAAWWALQVAVERGELDRGALGGDGVDHLAAPVSDLAGAHVRAAVQQPAPVAGDDQPRVRAGEVAVEQPEVGGGEPHALAQGAPEIAA